MTAAPKAAVTQQKNYNTSPTNIRPKKLPLLCSYNGSRHFFFSRTDLLPAILLVPACQLLCCRVLLTILNCSVSLQVTCPGRSPGYGSHLVYSNSRKEKILTVYLLYFVEPILYRIGSFFSLSANDCLLWRTSLPVAIHIFFLLPAPAAGTRSRFTVRRSKPCPAGCIPPKISTTSGNKAYL